MSQLEHQNIVNFKSVSCALKKKSLIVHLTRDMINGVPVDVLSNATNWTIRNVRKMCHALVQAMTHLEKKGFPHGNINGRTFFIDNTGVWKMADYFINPFLNYLANGGTMPNTKLDLITFGNLIDSLGTTSLQVSNFVEKCKSVDNFSDLLEHPLLQSLHKSFDDFEVLKKLGKGGFGEVFKVKDCRIEKEYAIKRIKSDKKAALNKGMKEVKALAGLSHKNIVRYHRSWTETMNASEYKTFDEPLDEAMDVDEESSSEQPKNRRCACEQH